MKYLIISMFAFLLFSCSNNKKVYWCGDHACINKKEKKTYFEKKMVVEIRELNKKNKQKKSELEIIMEQDRLGQKREIKSEKKLAKQARLEKKKRAKMEKELARQVRLSEKRRINEEKELAKQVRLEEKKMIKKTKKITKKQVLKTENASLQKKATINTSITRIDISSNKFSELTEKIVKKNMFRPYPNINDIPN